MASLARQIVRDALRIRDKERIWIHSWNHTEDLAHEIAQQAHLHGASVTISSMSELLLTHLLKKAPLEAVTTPPTHWFHGVSKSSAFIMLEGPEDPGIFRTADKGKVLAACGHFVRLLGTAYLHHVRTLHVRMTGFTEKAAKTYGVNHANLMQEANRCLAVNQAAMVGIGKQFDSLLRKYREIHLSSSEGSDLRFRTRGTPIIDDGIIDQEDIRSKNVFAQLPAGTISMPIDESSAEGTVVFNLPRPFLGDTVQNLRLDFKKGQITSLRALKGENSFEQAIRLGMGAKDRLTRLTFGINPNASTALGQPTDELIPGTLTLGLGDNTFIGGKSQSNFHFENTLNDAIVSIGPTAVIMEGKLSF
ncbi:MAG: aminopeptidase [Candidatus Thorarchaeota archaeon]